MNDKEIVAAFGILMFICVGTTVATRIAKDRRRARLHKQIAIMRQARRLLLLERREERNAARHLRDAEGAGVTGSEELQP